MPWGVAAAAGASIVGGLISGGSAQSAADTQAASAKYAADIQKQQFDATQQNLQPYMGAGTNALNYLQGALGIGPGGNGQVNPNFFRQSPGYNFQFQQGMNAIQNSAANRGGVTSGNTLKALNQFGQGVADQSFQQYLANLQGLTGAGQNAAANLGGFGQAAATNIGNAAIGAGNAGAAGIMGAGNAYSGAVNGVGQALGNYFTAGGGGGGGGGYVDTSSGWY